jgi:hypothetical protein
LSAEEAISRVGRQCSPTYFSTDPRQSPGLAARVLPHANTQATNLYLAKVGGRVAEGAPAVTQLDGTHWHKPGRRLNVPDPISLLIQPPHSPDLNPTEEIWQFLRRNHLSKHVFDTYEMILEACG